MEIKDPNIYTSTKKVHTCTYGETILPAHKAKELYKKHRKYILYPIYDTLTAFTGMIKIPGHGSLPS